VVHHINLIPFTTLVNVRPYRYPHFQKSKIEKEVSKLLTVGFIQHSRSPYSSSVLLVKKKDGTYRMCVDYRTLNSLTIRDRFPIPTIDEMLDELGKIVFRTLRKQHFKTHQRHYEYRVISFGLCNAPSTYQAAMNSLLAPFLHRFAIVFFDDILVYSDSLPSHLHHLETIFQTLLQGKFYLKRTKCMFAQTQLEYLGHLVFGKGVEPEPSKVRAMVQWPTLAMASPKELHAFLGLTRFYCKFIKNYATIVTPLTSLICKDVFVWTSVSQSCFEQLKLAMTQALFWLSQILMHHSSL